MHPIIMREELAPGIVRMRVEAPLVARGAKAGQFCVVRAQADGERIPLTLAGWSKEQGTIDIIFQPIGASTQQLYLLQQGEALTDVCGPLGQPSHIINGRVVCVGGGVGTAVALSQIRALSAVGAQVDVIIGARNRDLVILEDEIRPMVNQVVVCTDDGSYGRHGFVTDALRDLLAQQTYDMCLAIGPVRMMQAVANLTKPYQLKTQVSLNPIMIDGTGMCGCCRVEVGGQTRYACVDGPDFDGHQVDFDLLLHRLTAYRPLEEQLLEQHKCRSGIHG